MKTIVGQRRVYSFAARRQRGFTLIEVLVAILVLAFGMLGFALLQAMSVRFTQSANFRTQATNLSYEMLDQIRANRVMGTAYLGSYTANASGNACTPATGASIVPAQYKSAWQCRLQKALGDDAKANVTQDGNEWTVTVIWGDDRWDAGSTGPLKFEVSTVL